eukprot:TRINITY_DN8921_c0_g2_i1.p1 TRINITY_DN8921_c0_g2~~TRINITY_DN8921_c0_g2_i1.p1  ORF type:complete len:447 (-),score=20.93 TRINITY_DN8921_c0_g2_i1:316-1656(-)
MSLGSSRFQTRTNFHSQGQLRQCTLSCRRPKQVTILKVFSAYNNDDKILVGNDKTHIQQQQHPIAAQLGNWLTRYLGLSKSEVSRLKSRNNQLFNMDFLSQQNKVNLLREELSISRSQVGRMLVKFPKLLGLSDGNLEKKLQYWLEQVGCSPRVIINNPAVLSRSISSCKETVQFLKLLGINHPVKLMRKFPLAASLDKEGLKGKLDNFAQILNLDIDRVCELVEECPTLLGYKDQTIKSKYQSLKIVLKVQDDVVIQQAIWRQPQLLCMNPATIKESREWFFRKGVSEEYFEKIVRYSPQVLLLTNDRKEENWNSVKHMGVGDQVLLHVFSMQGSYFGLNWTGSTQMLKVYFAQQYLGLTVEQVLQQCPMYFTCSLMQRIASRIMFMKSTGGDLSYLVGVIVPSNQAFEKKYPGYNKFQKKFLQSEWPSMLKILEEKLSESSQNS